MITSNSLRMPRVALIGVTTVLALVFCVLSFRSVMAEIGDPTCSPSVDGTYDFNEQTLYSNGIVAGISFDYTSPYANYTGALIQVTWTAYSSTGAVAYQYSSPWENGTGANELWLIDTYRDPSTWSNISASVSFSAPNQALRYGHVKGYNPDMTGC